MLKDQMPRANRVLPWLARPGEVKCQSLLRQSGFGVKDQSKLVTLQHRKECTPLPYL